MLRRVFVMISVGLADSINPSTVGPALYLSTVRKRALRVTQFTAGTSRQAGASATPHPEAHHSWRDCAVNPR